MKFRITKGPVLGRVALNRQMRRYLPGLGPFERVLDIGSKRSPYRSLLQAEHFWSLDIVERFRPAVVCDAHVLPFCDDCVDLVFSSQALEHCRVPQKVVDETWRVLRRGGFTVCSVPFNYIIHGDPSDYWRFTRYALEEVFKEFSATTIHPVGNQFAAVWDLATANKSVLRYLNYLMYPLCYSRDGRCPCGYLVIAKK